MLDINAPFLNAHQSEATILDAWLWCYSDLAEPTNRGNFAEFLVYLALKSDSTVANHYATRKDWDVVDLTYGRGINSSEFKSDDYFCSSTQYGWGIEVKSSSSSNSLVKFDLEARQGCVFRSNGWDAIEIYRRWSDFYILAHYKDDKEFSKNIADMNNWEFFIVPTWQINQDSITLSALKKRYDAVGFSHVKREIDRWIYDSSFSPMLDFYKLANDFSKGKYFSDGIGVAQQSWCLRATKIDRKNQPPLKLVSEIPMVVA